MNNNSIKKPFSFTIYTYGNDFYSRFFYKLLKEEVPFVITDEISQFGQWKEEEDILLLMNSEFERTDAVSALEREGFVKDVDFFEIEAFLAAYYKSSFDKIFLAAAALLPSTACNLNCRNCLNFSPYAKWFDERPAGQILSDIDAFFACIDYVGVFHITGGEPFLYEELDTLIRHLYDNYRDRIGTIWICTNGTVDIRENHCRALADCRVKVTLDDYRKQVSQYRDIFENVRKSFEKYGIDYEIQLPDRWIALYDLEEMLPEQGTCYHVWRELRAGKLFPCNYASYASVAGAVQEEAAGQPLDLAECRSMSKDRLYVLLEEQKHSTLPFCRKCRGFRSGSSVWAEPAVQEDDYFALWT